MQFTINREIFLKPLQAVTAVIERRQTLPILSNLLLRLDEKGLFLVGTDMEVELASQIALEEQGEFGTTTVPARKLLDICRNLSEGSDLRFQQKENRLHLQSGYSRFNLTTLPATDFPISEALDSSSEQLKFSISQKQLLSLIESTNFAMAQQDVRYYFNGMLWEIEQGNLCTVATDGHRLALNIERVDITDSKRIIVSRKAIYELSRLLTDKEDTLIVLLSENQLRLYLQDYTFTSKLIDGSFPDYGQVIPKGGDKILEIDRDVFKASLSRVGVLSSDKHKSVSLELKSSFLRIFANNPEQEEAEDCLDVSYKGDAINITFNISYLMDVLNSLTPGLVKITLTSPEASARLESVKESSGIYVVMPVRL